MAGDHVRERSLRANVGEKNWSALAGDFRTFLADMRPVSLNKSLSASVVLGSDGFRVSL